MVVFGLYTQSGSFSAPTEMGVTHHVGSNSDIARAFVCGCMSLFEKSCKFFSKKKKQASSISDSTYSWSDNILTAAASLALPSYGSHYSGFSRLA
jgi:hypothetical protein